MKWINGKRWISPLLAGAMALQTGAVSVFATEEPLAGASWEEVEIGSDVWETSEIPRAAKSLAGVAQPEIVLNETTGDGTWKFPITKHPAFPLPQRSSRTLISPRGRTSSGRTSRSPVNR